VPNTCTESTDPAECQPCVDDEGCEGQHTEPAGSHVDGDASCDDNSLITCHDTDGDQCLNRVVVDCGDSFTCNDGDKICEYSGDDACNSDLEDDVLVANSSVMGEIPSGGDAGNDFNGYTCPGLFFPFNAAGSDLLYALDVQPSTVVSITMTLTESTGNTPWMLLLTECGDTSGGDTAEATCTALSQTTLKYVNETDQPVRVYVSIDADGAGSTSSFGLEVEERSLKCGDGKLDGSEECDDGNIFENDGCTPACELEAGFACTGASPSICTRRPEEPVCANVMCPELPADNAGEVCCTKNQLCGVSFNFTYGAGCLERNQPGELDDECPNLSSVFGNLFGTMFQGCCRPEGKCGLAVANRGAGCVERTELWRNMEDGFGSFLYQGPLEAISCDPDD
jgi:cysteine-rich repeat protein